MFLELFKKASNKIKALARIKPYLNQKQTD